MEIKQINQNSSLADKRFKVDVAAAFSEFADNIYRLAFVRTRNKTDAEDVLQSTFLRLVKNSHKITSKEHLKAWLIRTALNQSNTLLGSSYRNKKADLKETIISSTDKTDEVLPLVLALSPKLKTVIYLFYYEGYSVEEISKICSISVGTVKSRLSRARTTLKETLEGEF